jgi:hypothetical protein
MCIEVDTLPGESMVPEEDVAPKVIEQETVDGFLVTKSATFDFERVKYIIYSGEKLTTEGRQIFSCHIVKAGNVIFGNKSWKSSTSVYYPDGFFSVVNCSADIFIALAIDNEGNNNLPKFTFIAYENTMVPTDRWLVVECFSGQNPHEAFAIFGKLCKNPNISSKSFSVMFGLETNYMLNHVIFSEENQAREKRPRTVNYRASIEFSD